MYISKMFFYLKPLCNPHFTESTVTEDGQVDDRYKSRYSGERFRTDVSVPQLSSLLFMSLLLVIYLFIYLETVCQ